MAQYLGLEALNARFTETQVRLAFTGKGESSSPGPDENRVDEVFKDVEATAHSILSGSFTTPFSPVPTNLLKVLQLMAMIKARQDSGGGIMSEAGQAAWDKLIAQLKDFASGAALLDGLDAPLSSGIITSNDDGSAARWREYHTTDRGEVVETDPEYVPTLEKIL